MARRVCVVSERVNRLDANRLKAIAVETGGRVPGGLVVIGALSLYLDFINLFLLLLRASRR